MQSLVLPASLDSFFYDDLISKVKTHKEPAPSFIVKRFQFNTYNQKAGESIVKCITILCKAAEHCNYYESLSEMIRNRLVCGITITKVQKWLLTKKQLGLDRAVSLAQSVEVAEQGAKYLRWLLHPRPQPILLLTFSRSMLEHQTNMMIKQGRRNWSSCSGFGRTSFFSK